MSDAAPKPNGSEAPKAAAEPPPPSGAKLLIEFGPLVAFFVTNYKWGIFTATIVLMVAMVPALIASWMLERRLPPMALITTVFVLIFGGLTVVLKDELFIKLKPTIVNLIFAGILSTGLLLKRPLLKIAMGPALPLTDEGWRLLTLRFIYLFVFLAALNEVVWRNFSTETWVSFKVFGIMPITMVYTACQLPLITRHQIPAEES